MAAIFAEGARGAEGAEGACGAGGAEFRREQRGGLRPHPRPRE